MALTLSGLVTDHKIQLGDAVSKFTDPGDFEQHLTLAADDLWNKRPLVKDVTLTLVAEQTTYTAPTDVVAIHSVSHTWGKKNRRQLQMWESGYDGKLPKASLIENGSIVLDPPPTSAQISKHGENYTLRYIARHVLSDTVGATTVPDKDESVLLLRALIVAMRTLASLNITNPINLNRGVNPSPPETTPQALYRALQLEWEALS